MKLWNFVIVIFLGYFSFGKSEIFKEFENDLDTNYNAHKGRRGLIGKIGEIIGKIPGAHEMGDIAGHVPEVISHIPGMSGIQDDLWSVINSLQVCELRCTGKLCSCCEKINLGLIKVDVCMNGYLNPTEKAAEISMSVAHRKTFSLHILLNKMDKVCTKIKLAKVDGDVCIYPSMQEYGNDGFSVCAYADVIFENITAVQVNFDCLSYEGDITLNGRKNLDERTLALIKILNPQKFLELLKKLVIKLDL